MRATQCHRDRDRPYSKLSSLSWPQYHFASLAPHPLHSVCPNLRKAAATRFQAVLQGILALCKRKQLSAALQARKCNSRTAKVREIKTMALNQVFLYLFLPSTLLLTPSFFLFLFRFLHFSIKAFFLIVDKKKSMQ